MYFVYNHSKKMLNIIKGCMYVLYTYVQDELVESPIVHNKTNVHIDVVRK